MAEDEIKQEQVQQVSKTVSLSPLPRPQPEDDTTVRVNMSFYDALTYIRENPGKKVSKRGWNQPNCYCYFKNDLLKIHTSDGKEHDWILASADFEVDDWYTIKE